MIMIFLRCDKCDQPLKKNGQHVVEPCLAEAIDAVTRPKPAHVVHERVKTEHGFVAMSLARGAIVRRFA